MANLDEYLRASKVPAAVVARRAGVTPGTLSSIRSGQRRPSPRVAQRIEAATDGQVSAAVLLGLEGAGQGPLRPTRDGRWVGVVASDGTLKLPAEVLESFQFQPGDQVVIKPAEFGLQVKNMRVTIAAVQQGFREEFPQDGSWVDELIAERRAEAARD